MPVESGGPIFAYSAGAELEHLRHGRDRLDVVDQRRRRVETGDRRERRLRARLAALAFERLEQAGLLAADVRAGAAVQDDRDAVEQVGLVHFVERGADDLELGEVLAADVDEDVLRADRVRGDQAALDQPVRNAQHDLAVLERPRLRLVGVHRQVRRLRRVARDEARLAARGEERAAAAAQVRVEQLLDHLLRLHLARRLELHVAARGAVVDERGERALLRAGEDDVPSRHCAGSSTMCGTSSGFTGSR